MLALGFAVVLTLAMLLVIYLDVTRYIIPNNLNLAILAVYAFAAYFFELDFLMALAAAGLILVFCLPLFALGLMGGGDIKLLFVLALFTGWSVATVNFLLLTALAGGVLCLIVLPLRPFAPSMYKQKTLPRILTRKQPVPYGIAIAAGFLLILWGGGVPSLPVSL